MERLRDHLFKHFRILFLVSAATAFCIVLLMIRLKLSQSYFLIFLVWNLFLAFIPYGITFYLSGKERIPKLSMILWFGVWFLFLPNAPYIVTDFIHLGHSKANMWLLDLILISSYALCGLLFYLLSIRDMKRLLHSYLPGRKVALIFWVLPFLVGFGIYLGRFLRWNSWDVVRGPHRIIRDIWEILANPSEYWAAWLFTFFFGIGLSISFRLFKRISFFKPKDPLEAIRNSE